MDVVKVIEKLESMNLLRTYRIIGEYYQVYCPVHAGGNERKPSCGVLIHEQVRNGQQYPEGFAHCFSCGKAWSFQEFVQAILDQKGIRSSSAIEWLKENVLGFEVTDNFDYLISRETVQNLNSNYALSYVKKLTASKEEYVSEDELAKYRYTVPYMYERKLTDAVIEKFDVGVDLEFVPADRVKKVPCITFPVRDRNGNVLFVYRRAIEKKNFYMPAGLEKPVYGLYELPANSSRVILCESIFNCLTCYVYGYPALALFGTGTVNQLNTLKRLGVKEFVLGLDPDEAGQRGSNKLKRALKSTAIIRRMEIPEGKDINDLEKDEFLEAYNERM